MRREFSYCRSIIASAIDGDGQLTRQRAGGWELGGTYRMAMSLTGSGIGTKWCVPERWP